MTEYGVSFPEGGAHSRIQEHRSRAVSLMELRTRRGLITGKVDDDHLSRQTLGAYFIRSMLSPLSRTPW